MKRYSENSKKIKFEALKALLLLALGIFLAVIAQIILHVSAMENANYWDFSNLRTGSGDNNLLLLGILIYLTAIWPLLTGINRINEQKKLGITSPFSHSAIYARAAFLAEWLIIVIWVLWLGRAYLDMRPDMWPSGGKEYIMSMQNQYAWTILPKCGACFFWNSFVDGGAPSFIDIHGAWLHPITMMATFLFGVLNSGKVIVIASLLMAGIGQWWLGKVLKLSPISRLWTTLLLVASGALSGRMELGSVPLILSTAACMLVIPPALELALQGSKRTAIALGITFGLALLAGQGYLQIGLLISLIPMILILILEPDSAGIMHFKPVWKYFLFALILGSLIAALLLVPVVHNSAMIVKDTDPTFSSSQPLTFNLLNLVINDANFFYSNSLDKMPFPYLNINYIGWLPVAFAIFGIFRGQHKSRKITTAIIVAIAFIYLSSSAEIFKFLSLFPLGDFISGIRNPGPIQGLAVSLILALAGMGLDALLKQNWPQFSFALFRPDQNLRGIKINIKWIIMIPLMLMALSSAFEFSNTWLYVQIIDLKTNLLIQSIKTSDAQWVQPPFGDYVWLPAAIENGMKISSFFRPWKIKGPEMPRAYLEMSTVQADVNLPEFIRSSDGYVILKRPNNLYASITDGEKIKACLATSLGGSIDVSCDSDTAGTLSVIEHALSGWTVTRDGQNISLLSNPWLTVTAPAGKHNYKFRYLPWDAPVGIALSIIGWIIALTGLIYFSTKGKEQAVASQEKFQLEE
jgi:hypothetical protein